MYLSADVDEVCCVAAEEWFNSDLNLDVDVTVLLTQHQNLFLLEDLKMKMSKE